MKVVHVLKRIEMIDQDIKDLKKLEKSIARNKSFSTPIYMSIEKQINILLGERIKLLELTIANPPQNLVEEIEGKDESPLQEKPKPKAKAKKKAAPKPKAKKKTAPKSDDAPMPDEDDDMSMMTQDMIDAKFDALKKKEDEKPAKGREVHRDDESVKILDIALEKGTLNKKEIEKEKKVRFFRENFPTD